jgi:hypothetical protein
METPKLETCYLCMFLYLTDRKCWLYLLNYTWLLKIFISNLGVSMNFMRRFISIIFAILRLLLVVLFTLITVYLICV